MSEQVQDLIAPIFIGGTGRSGTTLLRVILDSHPDIYSGGEIKIIEYVVDLWKKMRGVFAPSLSGYHIDDEFIDKQFKTFLSSFFSEVLERSGKKRIAEKTPENLLLMGPLKQLFDDAKFIHVIRDGRDVACSLITMNWGDPLLGERSWFTENISSAARYWKQTILEIREQERDHLTMSDYMEITYEKLVNDLRQTVEQVLTFLKEPWSDNVLHHEMFGHHLPRDESSSEDVREAVYTSSCGRWGWEMTEVDKDDFKVEANDLLIELGYVKDDSW